LLSFRKIVDGHEGIVHQSIADPAPLELPRQPVVSIAVELQPERTPGWYAHIAQPQLWVDEVEVVM
jgi:hypothetical protein